MRRCLSSKCLLALFVLLYSSNSFAALNGTYTINPAGTASASVYLSLTSALSDLVSGTRTDGGPANGVGVSGPVILELASGYTSSGETFPLTLNSVLGSGSTNTITIRPASGVGSALSISSTNSTATININGGNYFIIDGRPGGMGSNKYIALDNTSTGAPAVQYINDAGNNILKYCTISGVNTTATSGAVILFSTTSGSNGNDNNTIDNCDIRDGSTKPLNAIYSSGTSAKENSGNTISNCNIYNFFSASAASTGIFLSTNNDSWTITGNSFYQTATVTATAANTHRVLFIQSGNGHTITNNYIGGGAASCGGSAWSLTGSFGNRFIGIDLSVGTTSATSVQGNTIANFNITTTSAANTANGIFCAINVTAGSVNVGTTSGNIIGNNSTGSISVTTSTNGGAAILINCSAASPAIVAISNNTIGSVTANGSSTSISCSISGILSTSSGTVTISGNTIGNTNTANSLNAATPSTSVTAQQVTGISHGTGAGTVNITNNTIANLNNNYAGAASAGQVRGIAVSAGVNTITGNTVRNLSTTSSNIGTSANSSVIGISFTSTSTVGAHTVSQNTIHSLSSTTTSAAVSVIGMYSTGPAGSNLTVSRNNIHSISISSSSTTASLIGLQIGGGTGNTYVNNMIRMGIDAAGSALITGYNIYGIYQNLGTSINIYNNSAYVGGTGVSSAQNTYAFYRTQISASADVRNNIFANARSNSSGSAVNGAVYLNSTTDYTSNFLTLNNNIYYAPGTGGVIARVSSSGYASLAEWQQTTGFDILSGAGDPNFVNATGNASAVDMHVNSATPAEGTGVSIASVTDDYDGSTRSGLTPNDIGADAGNFTASDVFPPRFSFTPFTSNTSSINNRTLSVTINDIGTGVPTSGSLRPRIWFRRILPSASSWASTAATFNSGSGTSGSWSFTLDYSQLSITPITGETYEYYLVAQDQASSPILAYSPTAGTTHTEVNTQTTAPTIPYSYTITTALPTSINVGTGQTYTSLTGSAGLFSAINSAALAGNTTVNITSNLSEDGTNALTSAGLNGYTLTIQPSAASMRTISNSADLATGMIRLTGASGVSIDGRSGGSGQYFRIVNTHTTASSCQAAVDISGGCSNNTVRNCILETNATSVTAAVTVGTGTNTGITISNNDVRDAQGTPGTIGIPAYAVFSNSASNVIAVQSNNVYNFSSNGIHFSSAGDGCTISGNSIYYNASTTPTSAQVGIYVGNGNNHSITDNYIGGQAANCGGSAWINSGNITFSGIQLLVGTTTASSVQNNTIQNVSLTGTGAVNFNGILVSSGAANIGTVSGNLVGHASTANSIQSTGSTSSGTSITIGIGTASTGTTTISNNTIANITSSSSTSTASVGVRGISNTGSGQCTISGNTIYNIAGNAATTGAQAAPVGILTNSANTSQLITQNTIYNLSNTNTTAVTPTLHGICTNQSSGSGTISRNRIYGLNNQATGATPQINGIFLSSSNAWTVANNQISITNGGNTNDIVVAGIRDGSSGTNSIYYNSAYVGGAASSGTARSYGYLRTSSATVIIKNNLFYNERSGSTGGQYAIGNTNATPTTNWSSTASNNNLFVVGSTANMGEWGAGTSQTLAQWQTSSSGDSASFVNDISILPSASFYTNTATGNLAVQSGYYSEIQSRATPLGNVTNDYANNTRDAIAPSIGSVEVPGIIWSGTTNNTWTTGTNWQGGSMPTNTQLAIIPGGLSNYPVIPGIITAGSINMASGATVTLNGGTLQVTGSFTNNGTITGTGKVVLNGTSAQTISGAGTVSNLELNNSTGATIGSTSSDTLKLTGLLTLTSGTLTTNNKLVLKSTASNQAAMVGPIPSSGAGISGDVIHERYLSAPANGSGGRSWRLLTSPIANNATDNSIFYHWQNSGVNDGTGIELFSPSGTGAAGNGLTQGGTTPSIRSYDAATNTYQNVTNTKTTNLFTGTRNNTFLAFVPGSYGSGNITAGSGITNADATGSLVTGTQTYTFTPPNTNSIYYLMGNPYACPIDFDEVFNNSGTQNINRKFWVIDPNLSNVGAYVTVNYDTPSSTYITSVGNQNRFIQTGQGFFVEGNSIGNQSTVVIEENDKETTQAQTAMFRTNGGSLETFRMKLYKNINNNPTLLDGTVVAGHQSNSNALTKADASKFGNFNENISIWKGNNTWLAIESRSLLDHNDTVSVAVSNMLQTNYQLEFEPANMNVPGLSATLIDNFANTTTPISLTANTTYNFSVTSSAASQGTNRFKVVFTNTTPLALQFVNVRAEKKENNVEVNWIVSKDEGIRTYDVERSSDGKSFKKIASLAAGSGNCYSSVDEQPLSGNNYYRIKAIARSTSSVYSNIVRVDLNQASATLTSYPNPATGDNLQVSMNNLAKGSYLLHIYNAAGQKVATTQVSHEGGSAMIQVGIAQLAPGSYLLQLHTAQGERIATEKLIRP